jgi:hypothetical protein
VFAIIFASIAIVAVIATIRTVAIDGYHRQPARAGSR